MGGAYGLKGNFYRRAELSSNLGEVKLGKERERGVLFILFFFFSKAYLADELRHIHGSIITIRPWHTK